MFFKQLASKESSLAYFFGCGGKGLGVAVDVVAGDEEWFLDEAAKSQVNITHVIDTHVHADHYSGGRVLAKLAGAEYCLHESDANVVQFPFHPLRDSEVIEVGNVVIKVLHTPGHTLDSICLLRSPHYRAGDETEIAQRSRHFHANNIQHRPASPAHVRRNNDRHAHGYRSRA